MSTLSEIKEAKLWVLAGGLFNCVLAFPLSMPFLYEQYIELINRINIFFGLGGEIWLPPSDGANMLFLNTAGLALFLVGMTLVYASKNVVERIEIPLFNGAVRFVWAIIAIYYINKRDILELMYFLVAIDLLLAIKYTTLYFKIDRLCRSVSSASR